MTRIIGAQSVLKLLSEIGERPAILVGPPGYGKTTIGLWHLRRLRGRRVLVINPSGKSQALLLEKVSRSRGYGILIDEAHRLRQPELLYPFLDEESKWFRRARVFVLTTTDEGKLPGPLRSRCVTVAIPPYSVTELAQMAMDAGVRSQSVALHIAHLARGSPRRVRLLASLLWEAATPEVADQKLRMLGYPGGLDHREIAFLKALKDGPKSLGTLAGLLGTSQATIKSIETSLLAAGLAEITSRGRRLTAEGQRALSMLKEV